MRQVVIMRGIPGSGKTTLHKSRYPGAAVVSADHFFERGGKYEFDPTKIGDAHRTCLRDFLAELERGTDLVVVDNTNTSLIECAPYIAVAQARHYDVSVIECCCFADIAANRNTHGVPPLVVGKLEFALNESFSGWPPFWPPITRINTEGIPDHVKIPRTEA